MLCRYDDQFVVAAFDNAPTADSEIYNKLDKSVRDAYESRVSYVTIVNIFIVTFVIYLEIHIIHHYLNY